MLIQDAIKARTADKPFIVRRKWIDEYGVRAPEIMPTSTPDCCIIQTKLNKAPSRGWEPSTGDLLADDWEITL